MIGKTVTVLMNWGGKRLASYEVSVTEVTPETIRGFYTLSYSGRPAEGAFPFSEMVMLLFLKNTK